MLAEPALGGSEPALSESAPERELTVRPLGDATATWDQFVARAEGSSFCHLAAWRDILSEVLGAECLFWTASDPNGDWRGVLPLVRVRSRIFGHYLVSLPFLNYGGPLGTTAARRRLVQEAVGEARRSRADLLELRTRQETALALPTAARKIAVLLDLPPSSQSLWDGFPTKLRSQIRRPIKAGLEAKFGVAQQDVFYDVFARGMRDLGTPVLPRAWFKQIAARFPLQVAFGVVYRGRQPLAAGCGFVWGDEFEMTWACALRAESRLAANMLLYWSFMEEMIGRGLRAFNFGRCTPGGGTHRFKQQWGGRDQLLPWCHYAPRGRVATPSPDDSAFSWGPRVWRRLPLSIANLLGPRLVRFLP